MYKVCAVKWKLKGNLIKCFSLFEFNFQALKTRYTLAEGIFIEAGSIQCTLGEIFDSIKILYSLWYIYVYSIRYK